MDTYLLLVLNNSLIVQWGYILQGTTATLPLSFTVFYKAAVSLCSASGNIPSWVHISFWKNNLSTIKCNNGQGAANDYILIGF